MSPIQLDPNHSVNTLADSTLEQAQANTLFAVRAQAAAVNAARVTEYDTQFAKYAEAMDARPDSTNLIVPVPAIASVVAITESGWPVLSTGTEHVCATKVWQAVKPYAKGWFTAGSSPTPSVTEPFPGLGLGEIASLPSGRRFVRIA